MTHCSKRVGIDKALYQVEQAVKRSGSDSGRPEDVKVVARLRELLNELHASEQLTNLTGHLGNVDHSGRQPNFAAQDAQSEDLSASDDEDEDDDEVEVDGGASNLGSPPDLTPANEETLAIADAENPLQLLARASYFQPPQEPKKPPPGPSTSIEGKTARLDGKSSSSKVLQEFFTPARVNLDVGDDLDPITLGLATMEEAEAAFRLYLIPYLPHGFKNSVLT
jgi:hypothetical protein